MCWSQPIIKATEKLFLYKRATKKYAISSLKACNIIHHYRAGCGGLENWHDSQRPRLKIVIFYGALNRHEQTETPKKQKKNPKD